MKIYYFTQFLCGSRIQLQLSCMILAWDLSWVPSQDLVGGCHSFKDLIGTGGSASVTTLAVWYWLWQETSVPCRVGLSTGLLESLRDMAAGFPQSERSKRKEGRSRSIFYGIAEPCHFHHLLLITEVSPTDRGGDYSGALVPQGRNHWGPSQTMVTGAFL